MNVLVNGIGNIGSTLLGLLVEYKDIFQIEKVYALKNTPQPWQDADLNYWSEKGVEICTRRSNDGYLFLDDIVDEINYIFDCTDNGGGRKNRQWYIDLPNLVGASAQGSEKGFGKSFMTGVNESVIAKSKFAHVVSCNTHSAGAILKTFAGDYLEDLIEADFVVVRRSEDIGNHKRLVTANVVARHLDETIGTHHSIDVKHLFETIGVTMNVTSSDITTPSQLMHSVRFNVKLKNPISQKFVEDKIALNPMISTTTKFDSNFVFERGRRFGFQGRIFSHAIIVENNLLLNDNTIKGWAFIPQEGNTILSTIHAFLLQTKTEDIEGKMNFLRGKLLEKKW